MATKTAVAHHRARVASLSRSRRDDDHDLVEARRNLSAATLESRIAKFVAQAPPLSSEQRARIAAIITADRPQAAHADLGLADPDDRIGGEV